MYTYSASDVIRVMNTDLTRMMERDRWHRERPEIYVAQPSWTTALLRFSRRILRTASPE